MNKFFGLLILAGAVLPSIAQEKLSLDSCRALALLNNKQLSISKLKQDVAHNARKAAHTKYLPHVNALGSYMHMNKEISILDDEQKESLSNFGSNVGSAFTSEIVGFYTTGFS